MIETYIYLDNLINENIIKFIFEGTSFHLWFLNSLFFSIIISSIFIYNKKIKELTILSILLFIFGLLIGPYSGLNIGINLNFYIKPITAIISSLLLFVTGFHLSKIKTNKKWLLNGFLIFLLGFIIQLIELVFINTYLDKSIIQNFMIGTFIMGLGVSLMAISNNKKLRKDYFSIVSKYAFTIYAVHYIYVSLLIDYDRTNDNIVWEISFPIIVFIVSLITSIILTKIKYLKFLTG